VSVEHLDFHGVRAAKDHCDELSRRVSVSRRWHRYWMKKNAMIQRNKIRLRPGLKREARRKRREWEEDALNGPRQLEEMRARILFESWR
jgi:hypothetical protein